MCRHFGPVALEEAQAVDHAVVFGVGPHLARLARRVRLARAPRGEAVGLRAGRARREAGRPHLRSRASVRGGVRRGRGGGNGQRAPVSRILQGRRGTTEHRRRQQLVVEIARKGGGSGTWGHRGCHNRRRGRAHSREWPQWDHCTSVQRHPCITRKQNTTARGSATKKNRARNTNTRSVSMCMHNSARQREPTAATPPAPTTR